MWVVVGAEGGNFQDTEILIQTEIKSSKLDQAQPRIVS